MKTLTLLNSASKAAAIAAIVTTTFTVSAVTWPSKPLGALISAKPMVMLVASRDHKLFYEAYNDVSDVNGDGTLDIRFNPKITYFGLFDSKVCYTHTNSANLTDQFNPVRYAPDQDTKACPGQWSGNWLNYVTTSRIDALRKVLYGGTRVVDSATETVLQRAYIPQDTHSWAKEYTSPSVDGYRISDYTPLSLPDSNRRHFFGNVTMGSRNCAAPSNCSGIAPLFDTGNPPLLSVVENSNLRVWEWASKQAPVLDNTHGGSRKDRTVRVKVCVPASGTTPAFLADCKQYGSGYKPVGLLHEYGENEAMLFGLLTGSYNKNMSGGVLRKVVSSFRDEVDQANGVFKSNATIVKSFDALRIRDFNNGKNNNSYRNASYRTGTMVEGEYVDWGNPVAEMMYEAVRYFDGRKTPTASFNTNGNHDGALGLSQVGTWDNPYDRGTTSAPWCAKPNLLVMSDSYPSYDGDQIPGSAFAPSNLNSDMTGFNGTTLLTTISASEPGVKGDKFIGQSTATNLDYTPSPKPVDNLATVRGLSPEEPSKLGSYYSAAVAYFGKQRGITTIESLATTPPTTKAQTVKIDSSFVTFASSAPTLELAVGEKTIRLVPFAKTIDGIGTVRAKRNYQPTDPVVDVYVRSIVNVPGAPQDASINNGRPQIQYNIIWEADEQGNDFDQDINSLYTLSVDALNRLQVEVQIIAESTGSNQNLGYVISGTEGRDGVYLVTSDKREDLVYFLNTPPGRNPGYCADEPTSGPRFNECKQLPWLGGANAAGVGGNRSVELFTPSVSGASASFLRDPLWYAAKWGGFNDRNNNDRPDLKLEWDADDNGTPDNYFLVQNPLKLKESLKKAFDSISTTAGSGGNVIANSTVQSDNTFVYQATFSAARWSGDLKAYKAPAGSSVASIASWSAADKMPAASNRKIFYGSDSVITAGPDVGKLVGKSFVWGNLSASEQALIGKESVLEYLRGDRSNELPVGLLRERATGESNRAPLGDISHSSPAFVKENVTSPGTVFVGANDGMLHAFNATSGEELFAYVPSSVLPRLKDIANPNYNELHQFYVDGDIAVSAKSNINSKNYLVGLLGRGGKGLYGLDVTDPAGFEEKNVLWENLSTTDGDLGFMLGRPIIAQMNNNEWVVIVGNGYNSTNGRAVLMIFNLTTGKEVTRIDTGASADNGLATHGVFDVNGDKKIDLIYAGDLAGNVWKFDVSSANVADWKVAFGGTPLFKAVDAAGVVQPITAPMNVIRNDVLSDPNKGKLYIHFGTGTYFRTGDSGDNTSRHTWYGLIDEDVIESSTAISSKTSSLIARTIQTVGVYAGKPVRVFASSTAGDMSEKRGFYIDFSPGERMVTSSRVFKLAEPTLIASSIVPVEDACTPGGNGYLNAINPFTGARLTKPFFDVNDSGSFVDDVLGGAYIGSVDLGVGLPGEAVLIGNRLAVGGSKGIIEDIRVNLGAVPVKGRLTWREIVRD